MNKFKKILIFIAIFLGMSLTSTNAGFSASSCNSGLNAFMKSKNNIIVVSKGYTKYYISGNCTVRGPGLYGKIMFKYGDVYLNNGKYLLNIFNLKGYKITSTYNNVSVIIDGTSINLISYLNSINIPKLNAAWVLDQLDNKKLTLNQVKSLAYKIFPGQRVLLNVAIKNAINEVATFNYKGLNGTISQNGVVRDYKGKKLGTLNFSNGNFSGVHGQANIFKYSGVTLKVKMRYGSVLTFKTIGNQKGGYDLFKAGLNLAYNVDNYGYNSPQVKRAGHTYGYYAYCTKNPNYNCNYSHKNSYVTSCLKGNYPNISGQPKLTCDIGTKLGYFTFTFKGPNKGQEIGKYYLNGRWGKIYQSGEVVDYNNKTIGSLNFYNLKYTSKDYKVGNIFDIDNLYLEFKMPRGGRFTIRTDSRYNSEIALKGFNLANTADVWGVNHNNRYLENALQKYNRYAFYADNISGTYDYTKNYANVTYSYGKYSYGTLKNGYIMTYTPKPGSVPVLIPSK